MQKLNYSSLDAVSTRLPILVIFQKSLSSLIQFTPQGKFLILYLTLFKDTQLISLKNFKTSSREIKRIWLNSRSVLAIEISPFIKWLTKRPNHSTLSCFSHTNLHRILVRRTNMIILLIDGRWLFKYQIGKENTSLL